MSTSFTEFARFPATTDPEGKISIARLLREPYSPAKDPYKRVREAIPRIVRNGLAPEAEFRKVIRTVRDARRVPSLTRRAEQLTAFLHAGRFEWYDYEGRTWEPGIEISITPNLTLLDSGQIFLLKMYFAEEPIEEVRLRMALHLLEREYRSEIANGAVVGIYDIARLTLLDAESQGVDYQYWLTGEAAALGAVWDEL